jgi:hypothetical protein
MGLARSDRQLCPCRGPRWASALIDGHYDHVRFTSQPGPAGAEAPIAGFDVAVRNGDGPLQTVFGFLDTVPAAT